MELKYEHATIIGKKNTPFARAVTKILNFFPGKVTFAPRCAPKSINPIPEPIGSGRIRASEDIP